MQILKFRIIYEDDENIFRDIEIKPSQTFSEFESVINSSYSFPPSNTGEFFLSNDNWQKVKHLNGVSAEEPNGKSKAKAKRAPAPMLVAFIDDPHQRFIYDYQNGQTFSFLVELIGFAGSEKMDNVYPVCVKQQVPSPFKKEDMAMHYARVTDDVVEDEIDEVTEEDEEELDAMGAEVGKIDDAANNTENIETDEEPFSDGELEEEFGGDVEEE